MAWTVSFISDTENINIGTLKAVYEETPDTVPFTYSRRVNISSSVDNNKFVNDAKTALEEDQEKYSSIESILSSITTSLNS